MTTSTQSLLEQFENQQIDPATFSHIDHVNVAYHLLDRDDFLTSSIKYCSGIKALTLKANAEDKYNLTITMAFLSIIAERLNAKDFDSFEDFLSDNNDICSANILYEFYSKERLHSVESRETFLLPSIATKS